MPSRPSFVVRSTLLVAVAVALFGCLRPAAAQAPFPTRPVNMIVTYPPGGGADAMARLIAPKMGEALGQTVVVDNRPGASGQIGAATVARAAPDGYTLMLDASSFAANPALYPNLPYDSLTAFRPIGVIALFPNLVLVNPGFPARSVADLVTAARAGKDAVSYASSGNGSAQHLAGALFETATGVGMLHVPYRGGGPALNDVIGGQVPLLFGNLASTLPHVQSGRLRALAITAGRRASMLPDVPTLAEAGIAGAEIYEWNVVFVPAGTPEPVVGTLATAFRKALDAPEVRERIAALGGEILAGSPDEANAFVRQQIALWGRIIKDRGITVD